MAAAVASSTLKERTTQDPVELGSRSESNPARWLAEIESHLTRSRLVRMSTLMFFSIALTRFLGFGFSVVTARALTQANFGLVTYALALAAIASILLSNSTAGMSPALARSHDRHEQNVIFVNYLAVVGFLLAISLLATVPLEVVVRLPIAVFVGVLANMLGTSALVLYRELQRGRARFRSVSAYNVLANLIQLVAVSALFLLRWRDPAPYIIVFGLSTIAAALLMQPFSPLGLRLMRNALDRQRMKDILHFTLPLLLQTALFMFWSGIDVVLLKQLTRLDIVGQYGAAMSLANGAFFAGSAIATALLPGAARLKPGERREYFQKLLLMDIAATMPAVAGTAILAPWLLGWIFGAAYQPAAPALALLAAAMGMYGISLTLEATWIAIGRPWLSTTATGVAALITLMTAVPLILAMGMVGAALAVALGSFGRLTLLVVDTARSVRPPASIRAST